MSQPATDQSLNVDRLAILFTLQIFQGFIKFIIQEKSSCMNLASFDFRNSIYDMHGNNFKYNTRTLAVRLAANIIQISKIIVYKQIIKNKHKFI